MNSTELIDTTSLLSKIDHMMRRAERLQRDITAFEPKDMETQMMTCDALRSCCKEAGVTGRWKMRHGELVVALRQARGIRM
jgi:hypothetical protein